jgi:hypothetical protein
MLSAVVHYQNLRHSDVIAPKAYMSQGSLSVAAATAAAAAAAANCRSAGGGKGQTGQRCPFAGL